MSLLITKVSKRFGDVVALDACRLTVDPGRVVGLLGPNGAGKTTLMRVVLGLVQPDDGTLCWHDEPVDADARRRIGYMPEERGLYPGMRVLEQVIYFARLAGLSSSAARRAARDTLERVGLAGQADRRVEALSHGNQQRAQLAVALVHDPALLILDEPFAGLDPIGVDDLAGLLRQLAREGRIVLLSSHQLDLVGSLCEQVVILDHGRVVLAGDLARLRAESGRRHRDVELAQDRPPGWLPVPAGARVLALDARHASLLVERDVDLAALLAAVRGRGEVLRFSLDTPSLEELFREAVGR
jgi:ABC-2 type transport system ATP-binding protein